MYYLTTYENIKVLCMSVLLYLLVPSNTKAQSGISGNVPQKGYGMVKTNMEIMHYTGWGSIKDGVSAKISYEMLNTKMLTVTANARYMSSQTDFGETDLSDSYNPDAINLNGSHAMEQIGFTTTIRTKMFGKPFVGLAIVNSEWSGDGFERVSAMAMGLFMLHVSKDTQFGIGPIFMVNTSSSLPAFVMFLYRHRFNEKWLLNLYGGKFSIDYSPSKNDLLGIGADIDNRAFYFSPNDSTLPGRCRFTAKSVRPMIKYRRRLAQDLYLDLETGVALKISSRVYGVTGSKEYLYCRQKPAPFLQIGASYSL